MKNDEYAIAWNLGYDSYPDEEMNIYPEGSREWRAYRDGFNSAEYFVKYPKTGNEQKTPRYSIERSEALNYFVWRNPTKEEKDNGNRDKIIILHGLTAKEARNEAEIRNK